MREGSKDADSLYEPGAVTPPMHPSVRLPVHPSNSSAVDRAGRTMRRRAHASETRGDGRTDVIEPVETLVSTGVYWTPFSVWYVRRSRESEWSAGAAS
jgi:hypothetical protein